MILLIFLAFVILVSYLLLVNQQRLAKLFKPDQNPSIPQNISFPLLIIIIAYNFFLYGVGSHNFPFIGSALYNLFFLFGFFLIFPKQKRSPLIHSLFFISLISGTLPIFRANGFVQGLNLFLSAISFALLLLIYLYDQITWKLLWLKKNILRLPFKYLGNSFMLISKPPTSEKSVSLPKILKTVTISLVVFTVFASLLSAADPIFDRLMQTFLNQILGRITWSIVLAIAIIITFSLKLRSNPKNRFHLKFLNLPDLVIPSAILVTLFAIFLFIQAKYLFTSQEVFKTLGLTYSEYVRKGFVELLFTTFLGGLIVYLSCLKQRASKNSRKILKLINTLLLLELFLMLLSSLKRNLLYIDAYGLTRVRVIGNFFLFWLAILLVSLLFLSLIKKFKEKHLFMAIYISSILIWIGLNALNIDRLIAAASPGHHNYIDHFYIQQLSQDAFVEQQNLIPKIGKEIQELTQAETLLDEQKSQLAGLKLALLTLKEKRTRLYKKFADPNWLYENFDAYYQLDPMYGRELYRQQIDELEEKARRKQIDINLIDWRQYNLPELRAYNALKSKDPGYAEKINGLINQITSYQETNQIDLFEQEDRLLNDFKYPFISIYLNYAPQNLATYHHSFTQHRTDNLPPTLRLLLSQNNPGVANLHSPFQGSDPTKYQLNVMLKKHISSANPDNPYAAFEIWDLSDDRRVLSVHGKKSDPNIQKLIDLSSNYLVPLKVELQTFSDTYLDSTFNSQVAISGYRIISWKEIKIFPTFKQGFSS